MESSGALVFEFSQVLKTKVYWMFAYTQWIDSQAEYKCLLLEICVKVGSI